MPGYDTWKTRSPDDELYQEFPEPDDTVTSEDLAWSATAAANGTAIFRYVPHDKVLAYARLGWSIADTLEHCHHGEYSILMVWMCPCPMVEPKR